MAGGLPTVTVNIAFGSDSLDTTPTFTDVTSKVRACSIKRGRATEFEEYQAGTLSLSLDNRARTFDPLYTAGPYYGNLKARVLCQIKATYAATTYTLWQGFVSGFNVSPDISGDSICQLEGYDGLAYLASIDLPQDLYTYAITELATQPQAWWPMGASDDVLREINNTYPFNFSISTPRTSAAPTQWMGGNANLFDGTYGGITSTPVGTGTGAWSTAFFFKTDTAGPASGLNPIIMASGATNASRIGIDSAGRLAYNKGFVAESNSAFIANNNIWHHGCVTYAGGANKALIYVDGVLLNAATGSGTASTTAFDLIAYGNTNTSDASQFTGELANMAVWNVALTATEIATLAAAGLQGQPYGGTTTDDWITPVLDAAGWPASWRSLATGLVKPGGMKWGRSALAVLQDLARTEQGRIFADSSNTITFLNRNNDTTAARSTTSNATYSDSGGSTVIPFNAVGAIAQSDEYLANRVSVTTAEGMQFTKDDVTSQTTYGIRAKQIDTLLDSQDDAVTYASNYLARYKDPILRISNWQVLPQKKASTAFPKVLDARIADLITFEIKPNNVGTTISQTMILEQIAHTFTPDKWVTMFSGSPRVT